MIHLKSIDNWLPNPESIFKAAMVLAFAGTVCLLLGAETIGWWLMAPFLGCFGILMLFLVPAYILEQYKRADAHSSKIGIELYNIAQRCCGIGKVKDATLFQGLMKKELEGKTTMTELVPALLQAVGDEDPQIHQLALGSLRKLGLDAVPAIDYVIAGLGHDNPRVRLAAVELLAKFGPIPQAAQLPLTILLQDECSAIREAAGAAVKNVCGSS